VEDTRLLIIIAHAMTCSWSNIYSSSIDDCSKGLQTLDLLYKKVSRMSVEDTRLLIIIAHAMTCSWSNIYSSSIDDCSKGLQTLDQACRLHLFCIKKYRGCQWVEDSRQAGTHRVEETNTR
jgi:hypothetical protein